MYIENYDIYEFENFLFGRTQRIMKEEKRISRVLAKFSNTLFFGEDNRGYLKMYIFNNNTLNVYFNFKINYIKGIIKLKNFHF